MRAVNLIPKEGRRFPGATSFRPRGPAYLVIAALALALAFVMVYVLSANTISERTAQLASLQAQAAQADAAAASLRKYTQFAQLAQTRAQTVRQIAATRFDWHGALADLSQVVPANTSLQSLVGTASPGVTIQGTATGSAESGGLRSDVASPAFELNGCTSTQDDVARLISRLRLINGVTRVSLASSQKPASTATKGAAAAGGSGGAPGSGGATTCGSNEPTFDVVVFFQPIPGAVTAGAATPPSPAGTPPTSSAASASSPTPATTPSAGAPK